MPFKFQWLCELLEELQSNKYRRKTTNAKAINPDHNSIKQWFNRYDNKIQRTGPAAVAFLSCLLPERRVDRVYNLQEHRLSAIFGRALGLGYSRIQELNAWNTRDGDDFPTCLERVMAQCEFDKPAMGREVTLEEVDSVLHQIAANSSFSSPAVRSNACGKLPGELLTPIVQRLQSKEAKWLVRMMLKSYGPVQIPDWFVLHQFHFMLPDLLTIQNSFDAAIKTLAKATICTLPARPDKQYEAALRPLMAREIMPELGVMIRRQPYHKARSIKHCCGIARQGLMSVERKYDGEYCQIHVDLRKGSSCLQIFSKSGKDSTSDRLRLHGAIKDGLRIDRNGCNFREKCIVEGELLVWGSTTKQVLPFHKIRKHVKHGGRYLGTANDSPVRTDECLMIVFYDLLLLDNKLLLNEPHTVRRQHLKGLVHNIPGRCIVGERIMIDFSSSRASKKLREHFANSISQRWEGLVLKGSDDPFFSFKNTNHGIKMKKDYMIGLGDSADLCLVGGRRDPKIELEIGLGTLRWTSFYVGCLMNKYDMQRFDAKPKIRIIDELASHSMPNGQLLELNTIGKLFEVPYSTSLEQYDVELGHSNMKKPMELFKEPFIVEIMGAGFERLSNSSYYTLRFPRKVDDRIKLHSDRTILDTTSFHELQAMAKRSMEIAHERNSQEDAEWITKLLRVEGKSQSTQNKSQLTTPGRSPKSPEMVEIPVISTPKGPSSNVVIRADSEEPAAYATQASGSSISADTPSSLPIALREVPLLCEKSTLDRSLDSITSSVPPQANSKERCTVRNKLTLLHNIKLGVHTDTIAMNKALDDALSVGLGTPPSAQQQFSHSSDNITSNMTPDPLAAPPKSVEIVKHKSRIQSRVLSTLVVSERSSGVLQQVSHSAVLSENSSFTTAPSRPPCDISMTERNNYTSISSILPTPPTSSSEDTRPIIGDERPSKRMKITHDSLIHDSHVALDGETNKAGPESNMLNNSGKLSTILNSILIGASVTKNAKSPSHLNDLLRRINTSFTHFPDFFMDQVDAGLLTTGELTTSLNILLVDFGNIEAAIEDVRELIDHFLFRAGVHPPNTNLQPRVIKAALQRYHKSVLVFDYNVLGCCNPERLDLDSMIKLKAEGGLEQFFGGMIKLDEKRFELGRRPKYLLKTDWSWIPDMSDKV